MRACLCASRGVSVLVGVSGCKLLVGVCVSGRVWGVVNLLTGFPVLSFPHFRTQDCCFEKVSKLEISPCDHFFYLGSYLRISVDCKLINLFFVGILAILYYFLFNIKNYHTIKSPK